MPDQAAAPEVKDDPFDLGNTTAVDIEIAGDAPPKLPPRGPDGKFLPKDAPSGVIDVSAVQPPPPPAPKGPEHPGYLVEAARDMGLTDDEIFETSTRALMKTVFLFQQRQAQIAHREEVGRLIQEGQVREPEPKPDEYDWDKNPDNYDPRLATEIRTLRAQVKEIGGLKEELQKSRQREEAREQRRATAMIDASFARLGKPWEKIFGAGAATSLSGAEGKDAYDRRVAVLTKAGVNLLDIPPGAQLDKLIHGAARSLFRGFVTEKAPPVTSEPYTETAPEREGNRITEEQWSRGTLARPTQRAPDPEPPSEAKAVRNLTAKMNGEVIPDSEELDGLL